MNPSSQGRAWARRVVPAAAVAVLVIGGTVMVRNSARANPVDTYRTTTVTKGSVEQRLNLTGSVKRVNQVSQTFAVSGTVASVSVAVGDPVAARQILATIDPRPLDSAVTNAKAALAQAYATLESDQSATTAATITTATAAPATSPAPASAPATSPSVASPSGRSAAGANPSLAAAQRRLTQAQSALSADLGSTTFALAQCAPFLPSAPSALSPTAVPPGGPTIASTTTTAPAAVRPGGPTAAPTTASPAGPTTQTTASVPTADETIACVGALRTIPTQQQTQRDQHAVTTSQADLTKAITSLITNTSGTATASPATTPKGATTTSQTSTSQTSTSQTSRSGSTSQSAGVQSGGAGQSAATRVVSDQAAVTSAKALLSNAEADRAAAILKSPIAGTVGSVSLVKGMSSQGQSIIIVGAGAADVTVNVPLASMATVHVGQKANVTPQGASTSVPGSVTSISLLPTAAAAGTGVAQSAAASSTPAYPVVVRVPETSAALASGSRAGVSLLIGVADGVLTVPSSALTPLSNGQALALTFKDGGATRALVRTGYAGTLTTQVISGLSVGQQVVLADLSTPLPTNTTSARRFGVGAGVGVAGGAGFTGSGLGGAGLGGAGLGGGTFTGRSGFTPGG